jgi:putative addiction module CopG family antidote
LAFIGDFLAMAVTTLNVSLNEEQAAIIGREVASGLYASASEVVREAIREWIRRRLEQEVAALEKAHAGAFDRDSTPAELKAILRIQKKVRAEMRAERGASGRRRRP